VSDPPLDQALATAEAELASVKRDQDLISRRRRDLEREITGLRLALERVGQRTRGTSDVDWADIPQTQAILRALEIIGEPAGPKAIAAVLEGRLGREVNYYSVGSTLSYLHRQGRVSHVGHGRWEVPD
jgi:hypothetical protein